MRTFGGARQVVAPRGASWSSEVSSGASRPAPGRVPAAGSASIGPVMPVPEKLVAEVVSEVSERMSDPGYAQVAIGEFAQAHPDVGRYVTAHLDELGGGEAVMHAVFHAQVLNECFERHLGRSLSPIGFGELDEASRLDAAQTLRDRQPALADYLASNVDGEPMRALLALVAVAMSNAT